MCAGYLSCHRQLAAKAACVLRSPCGEGGSLQTFDRTVRQGTVKSYMKKYISVHRTDATLLATNVDWKTRRVDSVCLFVVLTQTGESKKGGIGQKGLYLIYLEQNGAE
jgi:hypothetical protein